jgi:hypothetical protein
MRNELNFNPNVMNGNSILIPRNGLKINDFRNGIISEANGLQGEFNIARGNGNGIIG